MNKKVLIIASLIISVMVAYSSCKKKTVEPGNVEPNDTICYYTEPTEDQLKVVTDLETKIYGAAPSAGTYEFSLYNRFNNKVDAYNDSTTEVIVVFNDYVQSLTDNDYIDLYKNWKNGGVLVLTNPTKDSYNQQFLIKLSDVAGWYMINEFGWEGFTDDDLNNLTKLMNGFKIYDDDDPNQEHYECVGFSHNSRYSSYNAFSSDSLDVTQTTTPYRYGLSADQCIDWIKETLSVERPSFANLIAGKDDAEDWIGAKIFVNTRNAICYDDRLKECSSSNILNEKLRVRVIHDFNDNSDYYQIDQFSTVHNQSIHGAADPSNPNMWNYNGNSKISYFNYMGLLSSQIYLNTRGNIEILSVHPHTANNNYSSSCSTTDGTAQTITNGTSAGFSVGFSGLRVTGSFSASTQHSVSNATQHSTTVGHSHSINDISVTQNTVMVDGHEATEWIYKTKEAYQTYPGHWEAPLSKSDFTSENSELIHVTNPSEDAVLVCNNTLRYNILLKDMGKSYKDNIYSTSYCLGTPKRFKARWALQCVNYGDIQGDPTMMNNFDVFVKDKIFGSQSQIFEISTVSETNLNEVVLILESFMTDFKSLKPTLKAHGYTGKYVFLIRCENLNKEYTANFTVE